MVEFYYRTVLDFYRVVYPKKADMQMLYNLYKKKVGIKLTDERMKQIETKFKDDLYTLACVVLLFNTVARLFKR